MLSSRGKLPLERQKQILDEPGAIDPERRSPLDDAVVAGSIRVEVVRDGKHIALSFPLH